MKRNIFKLIIVCIISIIIYTPVHATTFPIAGVEVFAKSIISSQVSVGSADSSGNFIVSVKEESGIYNVFFVDQNFPPTKMTAKNGVIMGRIVVLTDGTTTKDPEVIVQKKKTVSTKILKKVSKPVVKKTKPKSP